MKKTTFLVLCLLLLSVCLSACDLTPPTTLRKPTRKVVTEAYSDGPTSRVEYTLTYDSRANLLTSLDSGGREIRYEYGDGRLLREIRVSRTADPDSVTEYIYNGAGRLFEKRTEHTVCTLTYDGEGRVASEQWRRIGGESVLESYRYTYDAGGRLLTSVMEAYGDTETWEYTYRADGRRERATMTYRSSFGGVTVAEVTYTYGEDGMLAREEYVTVSREGELTLALDRRVTEYFDYRAFTID